MKESTIEEYLRAQVEKRGGLCEKFVSPGRRDVPDRLITWVLGHMDLVELKAPGKKPRPGQTRDHEARLKRGVKVHVIDTREGVDAYLNLRWAYWT